MSAKSLLLLACLGAALALGSAADKKFVCYYGTWAYWRPSPGKHLVEFIDPFLCTHLVYGFAGLRENKIASLDPYLDLEENWGLGNFKKFNALKQQNPSLKTIIAIGGWTEGSETYSAMAATPSTRATFVASCVDFVLKYGFDGMDMDWEYPGARGGNPDIDPANFVTLLDELRAAFDVHGLLLTAAVSEGRPQIDISYDIPGIARNLDIISIMAYDIHGAWDTFTHHNSPLHAHHLDDEWNQTYYNVEYGVKYWISQGARPEQIVMGMPVYGRGFALDDASQTGIYAPASKPCQAGPWTREPGTLGWFEICQMINDPAWDFERVWDDEIKAPYGLFTGMSWLGRQWIGYDDKESLMYKLQFIEEMGLGGGMVWSLESDDFTGACGDGKNPILTYLSEGLFGSIPTPDPNPTTTTTTTTTANPNGTPDATQGPDPTTEGSAGTDEPGTICKDPAGGAYPSGDCSPIYYQCIPDGAGGFIISEHDCSAVGAALIFNAAITACDWDYNVSACGN